MSLYEQFEAIPDNARRLAAARLRYRALEVLHEALEQSGTTKAALAKTLGVGKSAVGQTLNGDGNIRLNTLADYLHALGQEVSLDLVPAGTARLQATRPAFDVAWSTPIDVVTTDFHRVDADRPSFRSDFTKAA
ncbi:helix-turn-helix transcriptional regulator [Mumia zhuanghuii]|uniref:Helix-turn-helix domain-containing protein n=2 Tax=Mumia TaxID=1546255 RepID=A0ABW1QLA9_9ACTN|nr:MULTISPECIES: helix-turn-helix transcriptional regulator [Mumia]KAA1423396.1 helix-turn-helix transcriptional regulator [Mumia zhuanghuii]